MRNKYRKNFLVLISFSILSLIILSSSLNSSALPPSEIFTTTFDTEITTRMTEAYIPSCTIAVIDQIEVVFSKGYGEQTAVDLVYHAGSINRMLIATTIHQLVEQGLVDLKADINNYLPFIIKNTKYPGTPITCKHLLGFRSGLNDRIDNAVMDVEVNFTIPYPDYIYEFLNENGSHYNPDYWQDQPGNAFHYDSLGYQILTLVAEEAANTSIHTLIENNILTPIGMTDTRNATSDYIQSSLAIPYSWDPVLEQADPLDYIDFNHKANYKSTVLDISKYLISIMGGYYFENSTILDTSSIDLMFQQQGSDMGLGIRLKFGELNYMGYFSNFRGITQFTFFKDGVGVVLAANQGGFNEDYEVDSTMQNKMVSLCKYVMAEALKINIPEETSYFSSLSLLVVFALLGSLVVLIRKRR